MTSPLQSPLQLLLATRIREEGPITLADFMQTALYHPQHGYYSAPTPRVGAAGDFITSVSVGPLFGTLIAHQIHEMWQSSNTPSDWTLVEQGANDGRLTLDILNAIQRLHPDLLASLRIILLEPIPHLQSNQQRMLRDHPRVAWIKSPEDLPNFCGVHLSNELPDAFPIRRFRWADSWSEERITLAENQFRFINTPLDPSAQTLLLGCHPPSSHRIVEIAPALGPWTHQILSRIQSGFILAFDYGLTADEWEQPQRSEGSLRGYRNHQHTATPLDSPGDQDITAHVDLSRWKHLLLAHGAQHVCITDQHRFCTGIAPLHFPDRIRVMTPSEQRELLQFRSLSHPNLFGGSFRVLAASKQAANPSTLSGFKFPIHVP